MLPASVAIDAESLARTDRCRGADVGRAPALIWASIVLWMVLKASEPPMALPPPVATAAADHHVDVASIFFVR